MLKWLKSSKSEPSWSARNLKSQYEQIPINTKKKYLVFLLLLTLIGVAIPYKISVTMTPSLKHRVYWVSHNPDKVVNGDYVLFHFADIAAQYRLDDKREMMKIIGCNEGEILSVNADKEYFCNGKYLQVKAKDISLKGEPLKHFVPLADMKVPAGYMFVMGQHKDSLDSRYFGYISKDRIKAKAYPLF